MPLSDQYARAPLDRIVVRRDDRQRKVIETEDTQKSILRIGLIHPIIVRQEEDQLILVAGERRLTAFRVLNSKGHPGFDTIPIRFADSLTEIEAYLIELEENIKRRDLPWQDQVRAIAKLHRMHSDTDPDWTQAKTAEAISMNDSTISMYLKIEPHMDDSRIAGCPTIRNAYDVLERRAARARVVLTRELLDDEFEEELDEEDLEGFDDGEDAEVVPIKGKAVKDHKGNAITGVVTSDELEIIDGVIYIRGVPQADKPEAERIPITIYGEEKSAELKKLNAKLAARKMSLNLAEDIMHGSFLEWAPGYNSQRFDFIHCDFPYGMKELGPQMQGNEHQYYEDSPEIYLELLNCLCENLDRLLSTNGWILFWYAGRMEQATRDIFKYKAPSLVVQQHPLIWLHSDNSGISPDHKRRPRHIYDTALLMHRGEDIQLIKLKSDAYPCHTDHKLHPSTKPEPMLRYFFEMFVDEHTRMLDPTCGSGSSLRAAESLGAAKVLGIEQNWEYCEAARGALKDFRNKERFMDEIFNMSSLGPKGDSNGEAETPPG